MRVTKHWINSFFSNDFTAEEITNALFSVGIEIDEIIETGQDLDNVVVAQIDEFKKHPDADKLSVCQISDGTEKYELICGAKNFQQGNKVALAKIGAKLPNGLKIKKSKIRGVESSGMLCSEEELGLKEESEGIIILPADSPLGQPVKETLALDDTIFVLDLTPNRGDCFSVLGVAMEVAAATESTINTRSTNAVSESATNIEFFIDDTTACPYYSLTLIQNVTVKESDLTVQTRLTNTGVRPINNIVDVTNYVLMERGQPLHAFDADKVKGKITVRKAVSGEKIVCLDEVERELSVEDLVIADESGPIAIAGVMGGLDSAVTDQTKNVLLESAWFDPQCVRNTSKRLNLTSESSKRFEREIDGSAVMQNALIAAGLIQEHAQGQVIGSQSQGKLASIPDIIIVKESSIKRCLGVAIDNAHEYLNRLGFEVEKIQDGWKVSVPLRRPEIKREIDVIEEIARIYGYQNIPSSLPPLDTAPHVDSTYLQRNIVRSWCTQMGLQEACTYSFGKVEHNQMFEELSLGTPVEIENPIVADETILKTTMIPNLIDVWRDNHAHQQAGAALFEIGKVFYKESAKVEEQERLVVLLSGSKQEQTWMGPEASWGYYDGKRVVEYIARKLGIAFEFEATQASACFHPGQSAKVLLDGQTIGSMGLLHPMLALKFDVEKDIMLIEISMGVIYQTMHRQKSFEPFSAFPGVKRDLAFVVSDDVSHGQVEKTVADLNIPILTGVSLFDRYQGKEIEDGYQSLAYRFEFSSRSKTLKDKEVDKAVAKITKALESSVSAKLR